MHPITNKLITIKDRLLEENEKEETIRVYLKEELQNYVLNALYKHPVYKDLTFYGGTCLRKIYNLNRLSEDLDFEIAGGVDLKEVGDYILEYFNKVEFKKVTYSVQKGEFISRLTIKFPILYELELSPMEGENLHIKVEINDKLSGIYPTELSTLSISSLPMVIKHYPIETLMAGKILACLDRVFIKGNTGVSIKGRNYYDLIWYMNQKIIPNEKKLLDVNPNYSLKTVFEHLDEKVSKIKTSDLFIDLEPLFENKEFIKTWCENFHDFYKRARASY